MQMLSKFPLVYRQQLLSTIRFLVAPILHIPVQITACGLGLAHTHAWRGASDLSEQPRRSFLNAIQLLALNTAALLQREYAKSTQSTICLYLRNTHWLSFHNRKL